MDVETATQSVDAGNVIGRRVRAWALVAGIAVVALFPRAADAEGTLSPAAIEAEFVADVNALRASKGLNTLPVDGGLVSKARSWASTMVAADELWHSKLSDGNTADWQKLGENVGRGGSEDALHQAFINSPTHYANLVDPDWDVIGIGVVIAPDGRIYVAEEFMELRSGGAAAAAEPASQSSAIASPSPERERPRSHDAGGPAGATSSPVQAPAGPRVDAAAAVTAQLRRLRAFAA